MYYNDVTGKRRIYRPDFMLLYADGSIEITEIKPKAMLKDFDVQSFDNHVKEVFNLNINNEFIFVKSWNEWAEGNILEPDDIFGNKLLEVIKKANTAN